MNKWTLKRFFALVLAVMMILTVPEVSAAAAVDADAEAAVVESTETNDAVEEVLDIEAVQVESENKEAANTANTTIIYEEIVDLGEIQTSACGVSFFGADEYVSKTNENYAEWIDRIVVSDDGKAFYNSLIEAVDNDGTADFLIDDDYYSSQNTMGNLITFNYSSGKETCNAVKYTSISSSTNSFDTDKVYAEMRAVYDAFDRDHPEVFWLSGGTRAAASISFDGTAYTATFYFIIKNHTATFDIRGTAYQTESAITTDITARDKAINTILSGTTATDKAELIKYFNTWLTKNNAYCTATTYPDSSYECLCALQGSTGTTGPVCEAYARAFKILCDEKNIPCVLVDGYATSDSNPGEAHMWNYVQVGTNWYAVDVTWDDPYVSSGVAVSGYENEKWLLVGADTVVTSSGMTFIKSHPVSNQASVNGVSFTNGPVLSKDPYLYSDFESAEIKNNKTEYGYDTDTVPTINVKVKDNATGIVTYKWSKVVDDELVLEDIKGDVDVTTNTLPLGLDVGEYCCQVYYNGVEVYYAYASVDYKEVTLYLSGEYRKEYDGNTQVKGDYVDFEIYTEEDSFIEGDDVNIDQTNVTYRFEDANAGENKKIIATGFTLTGDDAKNYQLTSETVEENVGTIDPLDVNIEGVEVKVALDETEFTYDGKEHSVNVSKVVVNGMEVPVDSYKVSGNSGTDADEYKVEIAFTGNYSGSAQTIFTISYLDETDVLSKLTYNGAPLKDGWYNTDVVITAEGYQVSASIDGNYADSFVLSHEGIMIGGGLFFKEKATGYITNMVLTETIRIDKTAPSFEGDADGISVAGNFWKKLLNVITFNIFKIKTQDVTISATETGSGIEGYYYYIDKSGATTVKTSAELDALTFTKGEGFSLSEDANYVIYAYAVDNAGNKSGYICTDGIVIDKTDPVIESVVQPTADNGNLKDTSATITFTASEAGSYYLFTGEDANATYTAEQIAQNSAYTMVAGENTFTLNPFEPNTYHVVYIAVKDIAGNLSSAVTKVEFTTQKTLPTITTIPTVSGTYGTPAVGLTIAGGVASVNGTAIEGKWSIISDVLSYPEVGATKEYTVKFTPSETDKYGEVTVKVVPTIAKKDITVTVRDASKVFGTENPSFMADVPNEDMVDDDTMTGDLGIGRITCEATKTSDVGTYTITTTTNSKNYNVTVVNGTLTITKATAANPTTIEKEYVYGLGSEGAATVDITKELPTDRGTTTYTVETDGSIVTDVKVANGILTYTVSTGNLNKTATITVKATSKNYEDITITVNIKLVDKLSVSPKGEVTTVGALTYGDALSKLTFGTVTFEDSEGNAVAGTITWDTPNAKLNAGTHEVAWTFTPSNTGKYKTATGTVSVTVVKATPEVVAPTVDAITYNPSKTLADVDLPTVTNGTWSWKNADTVPTVGNTGYVAVFTPTDSTNYNTVEKTVAVDVAKATPVVSVAPTASDIVYLNTLANSTLSGGKVVYVADPNVTVEGTWTWKDATIAPIVADSEKTEYEVVFTPVDTRNYNAVTTKITLVVDKAAIPANAPATEMKVEEEIVSDIVLPEGWEWDEEEAEQSVERGSEVYATAIYTADDAVNYETTEVDIKITLIEPEIYGEDGKAGWDVIEDEIENTQDEEIKVDMNGTTKVDRHTLETLKEKDKTMVVVFTDEEGNEEYSWTIKGSDVEDGEFKNVKMDVVMTDDNKPEIPEALVKEAIANAKDHKFLSLSHDGEFGFKATLTINVGKENAGKLATLYYYNEETGKLLETENIKVEVDANGNISLVFEHASDYVLSINDKVTEPLPGGDDTTPTPGPTTPDTGDGVFGNIYFYITLLLAGGLAGYVGVRKKREE